MRWVDAEGIVRANLIDATPIGANVRSTVATYADIHDELRRAFARTPEAKAAGYKAGAFSYNTGALRCPTCDGTGSISLDVQFCPMSRLSVLHVVARVMQTQHHMSIARKGRQPAYVAATYGYERG